MQEHYEKYSTDATLGTQELTTATENLQRVITSLAIPLGSVIIFASIVITALKMIFLMMKKL